MSTTPGKPRQSGIPTPGRPSGIPTPGRSRASSSANQYATVNSDVEYMSRAFADAIKANDPAQHRASGVHSTNSSPPDTSTSTSFPSGRRSVTARPSSVASSSSAAGHTPYRAPVERSKTPTGVRPSSRQSDVFRSSSRAGRAYEIGDNVRIESLGFEGTLKYIGEIDGKSGLWAGVELSGGFSGMGKNNGSVNGKQYFACPPNCGVFVATTKLSAPTVGAGALYRPSSVASSLGGRITPSFTGPSGRVTPSGSSGRITPSFPGRITPSTTPAARARMRALSKSTAKTPTAPSRGKTNGLEQKITNGSIASKYINMTAKQLTSRDLTSSTSQGSASPSRSIPSPTRASLGFGSPTRPSISPFHTPKPGSRGSNIGVGIPSTTPSKGRPSLSTPRARIPSAVAMPPPASPVGLSASRSVSLNDGPLRSLGMETSRDIETDQSLSDLEVNGKALQDKISLLIGGKTTPSSARISSRPSSVTSVRSSSYTAELQTHVDRLQARVDSLDYENKRLRDTAENLKPDELQAHSTRITALEAQREESISRISELESQVKTSERSLNERNSKVEYLERSVQQAIADAERQKNDSESRLKDFQAKFEDGDAMIKNLKVAIEAKEGLENQNDALLKAKNIEINLLESRLQKVSADWEQDKKELGGQVDELRQAGQETIALYEERLSAADSTRYELEDRIAFLEDQARKGKDSSSPSHQATSAAEIDNETLRDQVQHLQKKVQSLEDMLEDAQMASEREEIAVRERIKRFKEKEEAMKKELGEGRKEVEQMLKSEATARGRVEENEEALHESTLALEDARAEIEVLRTEIANLGGLAASGSGDASQRLTDSTSRAASERSRLNLEIVELKQLLEDSHAAQQDLAEERSELRAALDERSADVDSLKKKINRDMPINAALQEPLRNSHSSSPQSPSSKYDLASARDEITGLKHIVHELQKESQSATQRNKLLESENKLLVSETEQLRQEMKLLEDNVEQSLLREEEALNSGDHSPPSSISGDIASLQKALKEQKLKFEMDLEQLRKRVKEAERKSTRAEHDYSKEISELEALVESKIYREDELEQELEHLRQQLARSQKKSSKNSTEPDEGKLRITSNSDTASLRSSPDSSKEDVCEICERPGHDIFNCDLLRDEAPPPRMAKLPAADNPSDLFCEDCESHGHVASDCPHSMDVF